MEKMDGNQKLNITVQDKAYFHSDAHINLESTDVKEILKLFITSLKRLVYINKMVVGGILKKLFILKFILLFTNQ